MNHEFFTQRLEKTYKSIESSKILYLCLIFTFAIYIYYKHGGHSKGKKIV